jgi:PAS domain S-box-containing protein
MAELLDRSAVPAWAMEPSGDVVYKNDTFCTLCTERCAKPASSRACLVAIVERKDIASLVAASASLSTARPTSSVPVRLRVPRRPGLLRANLLHVTGEEPLIFGTFFEEAPSADALADDDARFRDIVISQTELIGRFLPDGTITFVNEAVCDFFGYGEREIVGRKIHEFVDGESDAELARALEGLTPERPFVQITQRLVGRHGTKWMRWNNRAFFDESGSPVEYQGVGRDVTRDLEQVAHFEREVQHKTALVREVHHRVNNHIQVVTGLLEGALQSAASTATSLAQARAQIDAMCVVHQLLCVAPDPSRVSAEAYLRLLVDRLQGLHASNVEVSVEGTTPLLTSEELSTLGLVATELLSNALVHAFPLGAGGRVRLALEAAQDGGYTLVVEDDGVGLGAPSSASDPGSLGLSIVRSLVAHSGGRMEQAPVQRGTRFVVTWCARPS